MKTVVNSSSCCCRRGAVRCAETLQAFAWFASMLLNSIVLFPSSGLQLLGLVEDFQFLSFNMSTNTTWHIGWLSQLLSLICAYFNGIIFNSPDFSFLLVYLKDKIF